MKKISRESNESARAPTVAIETHGCKLNTADSGRLARELIEAGYRLEDGEGDSPDVFILNSCTVTHAADRKARHAVTRVRRRHPDALIVATGCYAQRDPERVAAVSGVDLVVSNFEKPRLVARIGERLGRTLTPCAEGTSRRVDGQLLGRTRASLKIQEGCNQVCAYCIVPRVRGRERTIPSDALVAQVGELERAGCREVVLTGTQLGAYGFEIPGESLAGMLRRLLKETGIPRIRVSSLQPAELRDDLLDLWRTEGAGRLCPHFHIPLQSGSDRVLRLMRRRYTARDFLDAVERVRRTAPKATLTTDVIVGFPTESEEEFQATCDVAAAAGFARMHVFPYSPRPGTTAAHLRPQAPPEVRAERAAVLRSLADEGAAAFRASLVGQVRRVLWETDAPTRGLSEDYARVELDPEIRTDRARANSIEPVQVTSVGEDGVFARPLREFDGAPEALG